ncbi:hypothetical protein RB595_010405 [Gaeumannomyces hyphopodioides]
MNQPASTADLISYNITGLICHYSRLYMARDTLDIMLYIVRNSVCRGSPPDPGIPDGGTSAPGHACERLPRGAPPRPHRAAQIIGIANDCLVSAPCEIMRLFMGYIFIITFAKYHPWSHKYSDLAPVIRLDLPRTEEPRMAAPCLTGSSMAVLPRSAPCQTFFSDGAALSISRDARNMPQRLKCWGLAEKFTRILQSFESIVPMAGNAS